MKYKCLVLDHDDTIVSSTAEIHFPCFMEYLALTGREKALKEYDLNLYLVRNFHPGITSILKDELGMDEAEMQAEIDYWANYVKTRIPTAYEGIGEIMTELPSLPECYIVLAKKGQKSSTGDMYKALDGLSDRKKSDVEKIKSGLKKQNLTQFC